ncbi:ATP-binding cassette domain-containing protein [candidate division KSB1 bacterium]|nr:ATP-binding cassette domain-containing protein [candidate division KSB1 bacterium]
MNQPIIKIKNLTTQYDSRIILDNVSVDIYPNEITVILGKSGCGKTTLLKHFIRLYQPTSGTIKIFGTDVTWMEETEFDTYLRKMGVLFQNGALFNSITVGDNVAIPLEQHTSLPPTIIQRMVRDKLHLVDLSHAYDLYPSQLSGGMRKRAAMARAIALDPLLLFGDEPSAGLDPVTAAALDNLFFKLRDQLNISLIIVTHELESIKRIADRIIFLDDGKVAFQGPLIEAMESSHPAIRHFFNPS